MFPAPTATPVTTVIVSGVAVPPVAPALGGYSASATAATTGRCGCLRVWRSGE